MAQLKNSDMKVSNEEYKICIGCTLLLHQIV